MQYGVMCGSVLPITAKVLVHVLVPSLGVRGAEQSYVGVEHRIILAANAQCNVRIPFIRFSILSSLILCLHPFPLLLYFFYEVG